MLRAQLAGLRARSRQYRLESSTRCGMEHPVCLHSVDHWYLAAGSIFRRRVSVCGASSYSISGLQSECFICPGLRCLWLGRLWYLDLVLLAL